MILQPCVIYVGLFKLRMRKKAQFVLDEAAPTIGGREMPCLFESAWRTDQFVRYFNSRVTDPESRWELAEGIVWLCAKADRDRIDLREMLPIVLSLYLEKMSCAGEPIEKVRSYWRSMRLFFEWLHGLDLIERNPVTNLQDPIHGFGLPEGAEECAGDNFVVEIAAWAPDRLVL
jgi:hypothetical protein